MRPLQRFGFVVVLASLGAAAALACAATEGDPVLAEDTPSVVLDAARDQTDAADAGPDAAKVPDAPRCSTAGLCRVPVPIDTRINVTSLSGSGANDVWAVGTDRTILHYAGTVWEKANAIPSDAAAFTMRAVWVGGPTDVWIADGPTIRHTTGWKGPSATEWTSTVLVGAAASSPSAISGKNGAVVIGRQLVNPSTVKREDAIVTCRGWGDGGLLEPAYLLNKLFTARGTDGIGSLAMTRADEAWATSIGNENGPGNRVVRAHLASGDGGAGDGGAPDAGPSWQIDEHDSRTARNLYGVWGDEHVVWLVGEGGALRRMTRANVPTRVFENVPSPVTADLRGVFGFDADDVWAVGDDATVIHWDGTVWARLASPFDAAKEKPRLFAVWGSSPSDIWIGGNGVILHFERKAP
jgi:hypothetical protein